MLKFLIPAAIFAIYSAKQKVDRLLEGISIEPKDVDFDLSGAGLISTRFTIKFEVYNKSETSVNITSISGTVYIDGASVSTYQVQQKFTIPSNSSVIIPVDVTASNIGVFTNLILKIIKGILPKVQIQGKIYSSLISLPFDIVFDKIQMFKTKQKT